jgi:hypothetical protein
MLTASNRPVIIYISAASDLMAEREALARMIAELPVTLAWRIIQTPLSGEPLELEILAAADLYYLLMGSDIRAPVGLEWLTAQRAGRPVSAFLKQGVGRTPAGQVFINQTKVAWQPYTDAADLRRQARQILASHLSRHALQYALTPAELDQLAALAEAPAEESRATSRRDAGQSAVILSRERYTPSEGVIVDDNHPRPGGTVVNTDG